jgi:hypothetical protein
MKRDAAIRFFKQRKDEGRKKRNIISKKTRAFSVISSPLRDLRVPRFDSK